MSDTDCGCNKDKEIDYLQSELVRVKAELEQARLAMRTWDEGAREDKAEINRLKAQLSACDQSHQQSEKEIYRLLEDRDAWKIKAERLAEALKEISTTEDLESRDIAKEALAEFKRKA